MKKLLLCLTIMLSSLYTWSQSVNITETGGWFETAYVKWDSVSGADSYNVYFSGEGLSNQKIDNPLIRSYGSYFRADILGLKAGSYTVTVKAVVAAVEETTGTTTGTITVLPHDRNGFAFAKGRVPGAYKMDGTPKTGAVILYITEETKNTVSMVVTGANANPCVGLQTILDGFKKGNDTRPLIVRLIGQITDPSYLLGGDVVIENKNNASSYITLEGVGEDAVADGWGIRVKNATNIEIRNLGTMNCNSSEGDNIGLQQNNDYIWVHHIDFFYGDAGGDADQAKGDGALDCKKSKYVTFSYNHFWDSGKSNLLGLSESGDTDLYITYHHNWYDHSDSRHPRVRYYSAHIYNNYFDGNSKYGSGSTEGSSLFVEGNYFRNSKNPMMISMQGTDVWSESKQLNDPNNQGTFSGEDGGIIKAFNNTFDADNGTNSMRFVAYGDSSFDKPGNNGSMVDFDAYVVSNRGDIVPNTVKSFKGINTYNNFDTDASLYIKNLVIDTPAEAKAKVMQYAGRMNGGDFNWTFVPADDTSSTVNPPLKAALVNYETSLVYIQGEAVPSTHTLVVTTSNASQDVVEGEAMETIMITWGGDATDASVSGLPASGLSFVKDASAKTITITGTPTANVSYSVTTIGTVGTPISESGTITLVPPGSTTGEEIHNFTVSEKVSTFYNISGNMNSTNGSVSYDGLTLTRRLKIESATFINYTTTAVSTLTLVFDSSFTGKIKLDGVDYTASAGIVNISDIPVGSHSITKNNTANLFYIKTVYNTLGVKDNKLVKLKLYPNPVTSSFEIASIANIEQIQVYNMVGALVKHIRNSKTVDISNLSSGSYLVSVQTNQGIHKQIIVKK
ncbi:T9SS type A sorting domain-containing protein [Mariniflexile gromovii]|uniref:T9SS type A sorting domain-containing protein n=1 Tax=Mariniflexile gromovii TaxID=362523 RepID=A0ABS4BUH1_9FLAO|nr:T9SS type A sorting domain-containing protein [Mariniflexile gromovii]MBP0904233.1 T9SS type A sorting domain-containing protein [Mariniflexile gromovii]